MESLESPPTSEEGSNPDLARFRRAVSGQTPSNDDSYELAYRESSGALNVYDDDDDNVAVRNLRSQGITSEDFDRVAPGEYALLRHQEALREARAAKLTGTAFSPNGKTLSPISKNVARVTSRRTLRQQTLNLGLGSQETQCSKLSDWFDAGLRRDAATNRLEGARMLPEGYDLAAWASMDVPILKHLESGIIIWPVRMDLVPYFDSVEGNDAVPSASRRRAGTTLFCYTSTGGFSRLIAAPEEIDITDVQAPHDFGEEMWRRVKVDRNRHEVLSPASSPEGAVVLCASDPATLKTKNAAVRAVYRVEKKNVSMELPKVGHCVAVYVPVDKCMAAAGKRDAHVCVVAPPGFEGLAVARSGNQGGSLVRWHMRSSVAEASSKQDTNLLQHVEGLALLDGLMDKTTGEVQIHLEEDSDDEYVADVAPVVPATTTGGLRSDDPFDVMERELKKTVAELEAKTADIARRIRRAAKAVELRKTSNTAFLLGDEFRMKRLRSMARKLYEKLLSARRTLMEVDPDNHTMLERIGALHNIFEVQLPSRGVNVTTDDAAHGEAAEKATEAAGPDQADTTEAQQRTRGEAPAAVVSTGTEGVGDKKQSDATALAAQLAARRRRLKMQNFTDFGDDVQDQAHEVGDHFHQMAGLPLREVFGGSVQGVMYWLAAKGDPNQVDEATGWTAIHMATSVGDPDLVQAIVRFDGDLQATTADTGYTAFHMSVRKPSTKLLNTLLKWDQEAIKLKSLDGSTPLLIAVRCSPPNVRDEMVRICLEAHADPNLGANDGWSPLAEAVKQNLGISAKLLVQHRGNIFLNFPEEKTSIWNAAARHPGLQDKIKSKLNSRDLHAIERQLIPYRRLSTH